MIAKVNNSVGYRNEDYCGILNEKLNEELESGDSCYMLINMSEKINQKKILKRKVQRVNDLLLTDITSIV